MAGFDDLFKGRTLAGITIGVGAAWLAPKLAPMARPLAKSALKSGLWLTEKSHEWLLRTGEELSDLRAEVQSELAEPPEAAASVVEVVTEGAAEPRD